MSRFVPVAQVSELAPGQMKMVVADRERLLLVNMAGTFYVISDACGHDWAPLSRGKLEGHVVICPRHFARYDVALVSSSAGQWRMMCLATRCGSKRTRSM